MEVSGPSRGSDSRMRGSVLQQTGKLLRFVVDDYIKLKPALRRPWQFNGCCPRTNKTNGIVVNELEETITLPYLNKQFLGGNLVRDFRNYLGDKRPRKRVIRSTEKKARELNEKLRKLSQQAIRDARRLVKNNSSEIKRMGDYDCEISITLFLNSNHRLFHPETDNILCEYRIDSIDPIDYKNILLDRRDFNDSSKFNNFPHSYLFHDLHEHKGIFIDDFESADSVWIEYNLSFQKEIKFNRILREGSGDRNE